MGTLSLAARAPSRGPDNEKWGGGGGSVMCITARDAGGDAHRCLEIAGERKAGTGWLVTARANLNERGNQSQNWNQSRRGKACVSAVQAQRTASYMYSAASGRQGYRPDSSRRAPPFRVSSRPWPNGPTAGRGGAVETREASRMWRKGHSSSPCDPGCLCCEGKA